MQPRRFASKILLLATWAPLALASIASAQQIAAASESTITVSGAGIEGETYHLAQVYGDWFATATEATARLTMRTMLGPHQAQLGISWDGKGVAQIIDAVKQASPNGNFSFELNLTGSGGIGQSAKPTGSNFITVNVTKMDNLTLEATFSGTVTGNGPLKVAGILKLHRAAPSLPRTGTFGNCDPEIHDRLAGAEWRSPSDCEVKFDAYARKGLTEALQPVLDMLTSQGWKITGKVEAQLLTSIPRHTETKPFELTEQSMHQGGAFFVRLRLGADSAVYKQYDQPVQAAMSKLSAALKSLNAADGEAAQKALREATKAQSEHSAINIELRINSASVGFTEFQGGHTVTKQPNGAFSVSAPWVQSPGGGGLDAAAGVTYLFVGPFNLPAPTPPSTRDEDTTVKATLTTAREKLLSVQNICLRIETGPNLAQEVIDRLDWKALQRLLAGGG